MSDRKTRIHLLSACFLILFLSACRGIGPSGPKHETNEYKRYGVEAGWIRYEKSGAQVGIEDLYFDSWGMREAKYDNSVIYMYGEQEHSNMLMLLEGQWTHSIDLNLRQGTKYINTKHMEVADQLKTKHIGEAGNKMLTDMGGVIERTEVILGKDTNVWNVPQMGMKIWEWNYIPLKMESKVGEEQTPYTMEAIEIQIGPVDDERFLIPSGISIEEEEPMEFKNPQRGGGPGGPGGPPM